MKLDALREPERFAPRICRIARNSAVKMATRVRGFLSLDDARFAAAIERVREMMK